MDGEMGDVEQRVGVSYVLMSGGIIVALACCLGHGVPTLGIE